MPFSLTLHVCTFVQYIEDNLSLMSIGFLLASPSDAVIWRGPKKNGTKNDTKIVKFLNNLKKISHFRYDSTIPFRS